MINEIFVETKDRMNKVIEHFCNEISVIRTGRASTNMLDVVKVDYYGSLTPLKNIANITSTRRIRPMRQLYIHCNMVIEITFSRLRSFYFLSINE